VNEYKGSSEITRQYVYHQLIKDKKYLRRQPFLIELEEDTEPNLKRSSVEIVGILMPLKEDCTRDTVSYISGKEIQQSSLRFPFRYLPHLEYPDRHHSSVGLMPIYHRQNSTERGPR
jgi:hypothetical protein